MRILLFRHAPAERRDEARWPDDLARPLTARGVRRARRSARAIVRLEPGLTHVFSRGARRADETAHELARAAGGTLRVESLGALAPGGSWREVVRVLARHDDASVIALVGHEPDLGKLAGVLLFGAPTSLPLKKAGATSIEAEAPAAGVGRLRWWWSPGALRAVAKRRRSNA
ncbi:MAG: histidine phosphatase family protein [Candidatus Eisenbacteria bacterium]